MKLLDPHLMRDPFLTDLNEVDDKEDFKEKL